MTTASDPKNLYISRDGGLNWRSVRPGAYIYDIGDHGSIIVIANHMSPVTEIEFSWDEGITFEKVKIFDTPAYVENIITEPNSLSQQFIIYGVAAELDDDETLIKLADSKGEDVDNFMPSNKAFLTYLDLSFLHKRQCVGADSPGSSKSDYELWSPNDGRHGS